MPTSFSLSGLSGNYKSMLAKHRAWACGVLTNGESWPRVIGANAASASDIYRLGLIPAFSLTAPTTAAGSSTAGTYGIVIVYRSILFQDALLSDDIQSNRSNIVDVTVTGAEAAVLTRVVSSDTKTTYIDIYAAQKIGAIYGTFYRVVKDAANSAGTVTFSIVMANGTTTGVSVTNGTADTAALVLATDNDFPQTQPIAIEVNGRLLLAGGIVKRVTATFTNGSPTVTVAGTTGAETFYDGIEFWNIKRDSDTTGGITTRGTYLCRYTSATSVTLVDATGTAVNYSGTTGSGLTNVWTEPNRKASKVLNPHAFPAENINNDYPSAVLAGGKVPNTNRVLLMGKDWVIAEDWAPVPADGLNYISTEYGCSSPFTVVAAHGRLYWLDFGKGKRDICVSDGSTVQPISTKKIKTILDQITLDSNSEPWRIGFIHGAYYKNEDTIRWAIYTNNNSVANTVIELDLNMGDARNPQFYVHRYLDVFTYGEIRGRVFIGQYGYTGGIARIGIDNVAQRYRDWVPSGTLSGSLDSTGQTASVFTVTGAAFQTSGDGLKGIQVVLWQETSGSDLVNDRTYYHCRISANTATTFTVNYTETVDAVGTVSAVGVNLPSAPSGAGWKYAIGCIQGIIGPKWFTAKDTQTPITFRELSVTHKAQNVTSSSSPVIVHGHENFDNQPVDVQFLEPAQQGQQVETTTNSTHSFAFPKTNPSEVLGFTIVDNNCTTDTTALDIETITIDYSELKEQDDQEQ